MLPEQAAVVDALAATVGPPNGPTEVAHYTSLGTLPFLFPPRAGRWASLRASHVLCLNDRAEVTAGLQVLHQVASERFSEDDVRRRTLHELAKGMPGDGLEPCSVSFSAATDELGQWRGYAASGLGCAVVSTVASLAPLADVTGFVLYRPPLQRAFAARLLSHLSPTASVEAISRVAVLGACFIKHAGFAQEAEYRLLKLVAPDQLEYRLGGERLVPFVDLLAQRTDGPALQRIMVGPGWQLGGLPEEHRQRHHVVLSVARLLQTAGLAAPVEPSSIPYDPR
ncbi:MAG: DUF2971 domain-containing protein [Fimbriimonadaceae bacterium]|nr:DUF2971 domain-containing protein [Fimbriimonadaceae bacterium]